MKIRVALILLMALTLMSAEKVRAQNPSTAGSDLDSLRGQLSEVEYKEAELKIRLQQLDYDLKPENIERHFNGYGSTRPEELREARRRQLQIEKDFVLARLQQLASDRARLEAAVTEARAKAYQQSAQGAAVLQPDQKPHTKLLTSALTQVGIGVLVVLAGSLVLLVALGRRRHL